MLKSRNQSGATVIAIALCAVIWSAGCKRDSSDSKIESASPAKGKSSPSAMAQFHWAGKKRLATTNFTYLATLWSMPESAALETQTVDRLALVPGRWILGTNPPAPVVTPPELPPVPTNATTAWLRPLAEDLIKEESFWESRKPGELVFGVRLEESRGGLWATNLAEALKSLTGAAVRPTADGKGWSWSQTGTNGNRSVALARVGGWTLTAWGPNAETSLADMRARVEKGGQPGDGASLPANALFTGELDLAQMPSLIPDGWFSTNELPRVSLSFLGDGETVRTLGKLTFPQPLPLKFEPWTLPTNLIHDPLSSFTAIQGVGHWLSDSPFWKRWMPGIAPNQVYFWGQGKLPLQNYAAMPVTGGSNRIVELAQRLSGDGSTWLSSNSFGKFEQPSNSLSVVWSGIPFADPNLKLIEDGGREYLVAGLGAAPFTNRAFPFELAAQLTSTPKLVAYDWEMSGSRIEAWIYESQLFRLLSRQQQVPPPSPSIAWLKALDGRLGNCGTSVMLTAPNELSIVRRSSIGLTAFELNLFVDWTESPTFPAGTHTSRVPVPPRKKKPAAASPVPAPAGAEKP